MELRDYLKIFTRSIWLIIGITIGVTALVILWSVLQPVQYESGITIAVNKPNPVPQRNAAYYQYDKYYSIQASSLYADTLTAWFSSPGTAKEIFEEANLPVPDISLKKLGRIFKPRRQPPVTIGITVKDKDKNKAESLVKAALAIAEQKTEEQRKTDDPDNYLTILSGPIVTEEVRQDLAINTLIGLLAGLIIGLFTTVVREYMRK